MPDLNGYADVDDLEEVGPLPDIRALVVAVGSAKIVVVGRDYPEEVVLVHCRCNNGTEVLVALDEDDVGAIVRHQLKMARTERSDA